MVVDPILVVRGAHKHFGGVAALRGADLTLYPGRSTDLLGENGAGKSTLLTTVAGVHRLDSGEITFAGPSVRTGQHPAGPGAGCRGDLPGTGLFPDLTIAENVFRRPPAHPARPGRLGRDADPNAELFALLGVYLDPDRARPGCPLPTNSLWRSSRRCPSTPW
jgi:ABC-type sugar transport system ATPase subunit